MDIIPFKTERWFERYEFTCPHLLAASDCESMTIAELLQIAACDETVLTEVVLGYSEATGSPALRRAIAGTYEHVEADDVVVLGAPQEGIFLAMHALLEPGDAVVVLTPCYDSLLNIAQHLKADVHPWWLRATASGWELDREELVALLGRARPRVLVVNFPHNPTGYQPTPEELAWILEQARGSGTLVFCDEMYRGLALAHAELPSAADLDEEAVVLNGLSKSYGLPGLRCGWLVVRDPELRRRIVGWKHYTTICPPAPVEVLAGVAVGVREVLWERSRLRIAENVGLARGFFAGREGFVFRAPQAGSVGLVETPWPDAEVKCRELAERHGVLLLPGECMGAGAGFVRVGLGRAGVEEGLRALGRALG